VANSRRLLVLPMSWLIACTADDRPSVLFVPEDPSLFATPWPSDLRRDEDGTVDVSGFPNPFNIPLLDSYLTLADGLDGFSNVPPIWFPLDGAADPEGFPGQGAEPTAGDLLQLIDVDPASPEFGRRFPLKWETRDQGGAYAAAHMVTISPYPGFPLRPSTRYAAILAAEVAAPSEALAASLRGDGEAGPLHADAVAALSRIGVRRSQIGGLAVFTTDDPVEEMARAATFVREAVASPDLDLPVELESRRDSYTLWRTHYPGPVFQQGARPYASAGGDFAFEADGTPIIDSWDDMRLAVATPPDLSAVPEGGWPVLLFLDGTGGSYRTCCSSEYPGEPAYWAANEGMVVLSIDLPLHGTRDTPDTNVELHSFNILQPSAARGNFRQGGLDVVYLAHALHTQGATFTTPDGDKIPINPDRIVYMGHSQGALSGALAIPWFEDDVQASLLSGGGGQLAITAVQRKDTLDYEELVRSLLRFQPEETLTELHPVLALAQWLVDVTDPIHYSPYWSSDKGYWGRDGGAHPTLLISGTLDAQTPHDTSRALAVAAGVPPLAPDYAPARGWELAGLKPTWSPSVFAAQGFDGPVTSAFSAWPGGSHWVVFEDDRAIAMAASFLRTGADGAPAIVRVR
jgi:hypothetical protein